MRLPTEPPISPAYTHVCHHPFVPEHHDSYTTTFQTTFSQPRCCKRGHSSKYDQRASRRPLIEGGGFLQQPGPAPDHNMGIFTPRNIIIIHTCAEGTCTLRGNTSIYERMGGYTDKGMRGFGAYRHNSTSPLCDMYIYKRSTSSCDPSTPCFCGHYTNSFSGDKVQARLTSPNECPSLCKADEDSYTSGVSDRRSIGAVSESHKSRPPDTVLPKHTSHTAPIRKRHAAAPRGYTMA